MARVIETYLHAGPGYNPFLIRDGWQVAQLNYMPELQATDIRRVERHLVTDEAFILFQGASILIAATQAAEGLQFETELMKPGVTYNIPVGTWHNIAMAPQDVVIIVEKSNTHRNDDHYRDLSEQEYMRLQAAIEVAKDGARPRRNLSGPGEGCCMPAAKL